MEIFSLIKSFVEILLVLVNVNLKLIIFKFKENINL